jgi:phospholipase D1/2
VPEIFLNDDTFKCEIQVLRSASKWSIGFEKTETSILKAYHELITNSKHYIYIENLYFVSMIDSEDVTNGICEVLCERIVKADQ